GPNRHDAGSAEFCPPLLPVVIPQYQAEQSRSRHRRRAGSGDASGGHVLDGFAGVWPGQRAADVDERDIAGGTGMRVARLFHVAAAEAAGSAAERSAAERTGGTCRRARINRTAPLPVRRAMRRETPMCGAFFTSSRT